MMSKDILLKGLTRPKMKWGVGYQYLMIAFFVGALMSRFTNVIIGIITGAVLYYIGKWLYRYDYYFINVLAKKLEHSMPIRNIKYWKSNSYKP